MAAQRAAACSSNSRRPVTLVPTCVPARLRTRAFAPSPTQGDHTTFTVRFYNVALVFESVTVVTAAYKENLRINAAVLDENSPVFVVIEKACVAAGWPTGYVSAVMVAAVIYAAFHVDTFLTMPAHVDISNLLGDEAPINVAASGIAMQPPPPQVAYWPVGDVPAAGTSAVPARKAKKTAVKRKVAPSEAPHSKASPKTPKAERAQTERRASKIVSSGAKSVAGMRTPAATLRK